MPVVHGVAKRDAPGREVGNRSKGGVAIQGKQSASVMDEKAAADDEQIALQEVFAAERVAETIG